jgi:hypothetical protein
LGVSETAATPPAETETPPAEDAETPEVEETPAETTETPPAEVPAEGETADPVAEAAKPKDEKAEITEEALKAAAVRFANKTMAAARRARTAAEDAEARIESTKLENTTLKSHLDEYKQFVQDLRTDPLSALKRVGVGDGTTRGFLDHRLAGGEETKPPVEDQIAELRKEREKERAEAAREREVARIDRAIATTVTTDKTKFARVSTKYGQNVLWSTIAAYNEQHGQVPDEAIPLLAAEVEKDLRAEFGDPVSAPSSGEKKTTPAAADAATAARTSGKTLTNKQSSGGPTVREYSLDPEERQRQVNEDLRKDGLL